MIFHICSHRISKKPSGTKWLNTILKNSSTSLSEELHEFSDYDFIDLHCSPKKQKQKETFCNIYSSIKLCFDQRFGYISFAGSYCCALWVHTKLLNFVFLGKYCNSGLKLPSETFRARSNFVPVLQCEKNE